MGLRTRKQILKKSVRRSLNTRVLPAVVFKRILNMRDDIAKGISLPVGCGEFDIIFVDKVFGHKVSSCLVETTREQGHVVQIPFALLAFLHFFSRLLTTFPCPAGEPQISQTDVENINRCEKVIARLVREQLGIPGPRYCHHPNSESLTLRRFFAHSIGIEERLKSLEDAIDRLDLDMSATPRSTDTDGVAEIVSNSLFFYVAHEVQHVARHHFQMAELVRAGTTDLTERGFTYCAETDADQFALTMLLSDRLSRASHRAPADWTPWVMEQSFWAFAAALTATVWEQAVAPEPPRSGELPTWRVLGEAGGTQVFAAPQMDVRRGWGHYPSSPWRILRLPRIALAYPFNLIVDAEKWRDKIWPHFDKMRVDFVRRMIHIVDNLRSAAWPELLAAGGSLFMTKGEQNREDEYVRQQWPAYERTWQSLATRRQDA